MVAPASTRLWRTPELKVHIAKALDTQHALLHLAQTDKATCALLLPLLYEHINVAIDHVYQIAEIFKKYPAYAAQCKRLRVESPDKIERSYLAGKMWRDKGVVVNFQPDPSKRYDADFSPHWEDDHYHVASPSEDSDPIEWAVPTDQDAEETLHSLFRELGCDGDGADNEGASDGLADVDSEADEDNEDEDGSDEDEDGFDEDEDGFDEDEDSSDDENEDAQDPDLAMVIAAFQGAGGLPQHDDEPESGDGPSEDGPTAGFRFHGVSIMEYWQAMVERHKDDTSPAWLKKKQAMEDHIRKRQDKGPRVVEGLARLKTQCDALALVLTQLSEIGRLVSFEWVWEASDREVWRVTGGSSELWAAVEKNASSLQKLVLKLFWGDMNTWKSFTSTHYQPLKILHLNMANMRYTKARPLVNMLKDLPELEALHINLPSTYNHMRQFKLEGTYPKLRYFHWECDSDERRRQPGRAGTAGFFLRHLNIDTLHILCTADDPFNYDDDSILPHLRAVSYTGYVSPDHFPLGPIVSRRPVVIVRSQLPAAGLLSFVRLPVAASATVQWLDVRYYSNFRLDLATYGKALRAAPRLRELTIRTRSERFDGRLTPLDIPDVLRAIPHDHPLTALTLFDPDGDTPTARDLAHLPPTSPALRYLGWETYAGRVLYALEQQGNRTVATEIPYPRKQSWVWTQNSILDHADGELWTDPFSGDVVPGLSQL